jgi:signal transduction histidine kinase/BarA-like signal transduction histidine kinase
MGDVLSGKVPGVRNGEVHIERPDGSRVIVIVNIAPLTDEHGEIVGAINCFYDVTERKRLEHEREMLLTKEQNSRLEAEGANRSKDVFLATLSHEVRTPLSAVLGWATILRQKQCTEAELREGLEVIERNCKAQVQLINDVLDVSRIACGKLRLDVRPCDLASVIDAAMDVVSAAANAKNIEIVTRIDPEASPACCDDVRMQQVIWNLLANAIKFTPKGGRVQISLERNEADVRIVVRDNGQGIDRELLPYVFQRFRQADTNTRRGVGGLGLGLSIVKHIVELHGGTVEASSDGEGRGATFIVYLPVQATPDDTIGRGAEGSCGERTASSQADPAEPPVWLDGLHVLVVEDDADARRLVAKVLMEAGAKVSVAGTAREAMQALRKQKPDVLVSDLALPHEDGFDLMRKVRDAGHTAQQLPAIALTAFAHKSDAQRALSGGFQIRLSKPVDPGELIAAVANLAARAT